MKRQLTPAATFNPAAGTLDLSSIPSFDIRRLVAVIDLKTGTLVYAPVAGSGASSVAGAGVLTLQASVASLNASDPLFVLYDDSTGKVAEDASVQAVTAAIQALALDVVNNHADLSALHTDLSQTLHQDLQSILSKLGAAPAQDGADAAGVTMPAGGAGIRGWLSGVYSRLSNTLPVSLGSIPLAPGAAQDGTDITGASMPAGGAGIRGWLSAIYTKLTGTVAVSALSLPLPAGAAQDATVGQAVAVLNNVLTALGALATTTNVQATTTQVAGLATLLSGIIKVDPSSVVSPISAAALPLPAGAATDASLQSIKAILATQASIAESTWYDPTVTPNLFYFRRVSSTDGVVSEIWTDPTGAQVTFSANWKPLSSTTSFQVLPAVTYDTVAAFTGANLHDVIVRIVILNLGVTPPTIAASLWLNANSGAVLSSVTMANLNEATRDISIPDGNDVTFGAQADAPLATPGTAGSYMGTFRGFWTNWLARVPVLGAAVSGASTPVALATDQIATLAKDGSDATGVAAPTGAAGIRGWLSGIYGLLKTGTIAVSNASLPLPAGAAQDGVDATGVAAPAGGTGIRGWLSGIYGLLKGTLAVSAASLPLPTGAAADGTDMTMPTGVTAPASGGGIRGWLSASWVALQALAAAVGTQADVAVPSATGTGSLFGWIKWSAGNDTQAIAAITATQTWQQSALTIWQAIQAILGQAKTTGTLTAASGAGSTVSLAYTGSNGTGTIKLSGTWAGTVTAWGTVDGIAYDFPLMMVPAANPPVAAVSSATANGDYYVDLSGCLGFQVVMSPYTSGSCTVALAATGGMRRVRVAAPAADPIAVAPGTGAVFPMAGLVAAADPSGLTNGAAAEASFDSTGRLRVNTGRYGVGGLFAVPGSSANGTPLGTPPAVYHGVEFWIPSPASITLTIQSAQPTSAPPAAAFPNPSTSGITLIQSFELSQQDGQLPYVTGLTGQVMCRWY